MQIGGVIAHTQSIKTKSYVMPRTRDVQLEPFNVDRVESALAGISFAMDGQIVVTVQMKSAIWIEYEMMSKNAQKKLLNVRWVDDVFPEPHYVMERSNVLTEKTKWDAIHYDREGISDCCMICFAI